MKKKSRKRIGQPISITLTPEQREWVDSLIPPGGTRTDVVRGIIQTAMAICHGQISPSNGNP